MPSIEECTGYLGYDLCKILSAWLDDLAPVDRTAGIRGSKFYLFSRMTLPFFYYAPPSQKRGKIQFQRLSASTIPSGSPYLPYRRVSYSML